MLLLVYFIVAHVWEGEKFTNTAFKHPVINFMIFPIFVYLSFVTRGHVNEVNLVLKVQRLLYPRTTGTVK